jgi:hypothetical protein
VFDTSSLEHPKLLSTFATESAVPGTDGKVATDGVYSVHNAVIKGDRSYASWYSDGVRVVDLSDPGDPQEVAWFVPPPTSPRQTAATAQGGRRDMPVVWGVFPWKGMVLASDMNSGLWVFRVTDDGVPRTEKPPSPVPTTAPDPPPAPTGDSGSFLWVGLAGLVLGLLAVGTVVRAAARRRPG